MRNIDLQCRSCFKGCHHNDELICPASCGVGGVVGTTVMCKLSLNPAEANGR